MVQSFIMICSVLKVVKDVLTSLKLINSKLYDKVGTSCSYDTQSDQQENKSRVLPPLLFYRNVWLSLIVHICIPTCYAQSFYWLPTFTTYLFWDNCCLQLRVQETSVNFAEIENFFQGQHQHRCFKTDVSLNVKCCFCLLCRFSPL
jgi:hypothetical protein